MKASLKSSPKVSISAMRIEKGNSKEKTSNHINSKANLLYSIDNNITNNEIKPHHRKSIIFIRNFIIDNLDLTVVANEKSLSFTKNENGPDCNISNEFEEKKIILSPKSKLKVLHF